MTGKAERLAQILDDLVGVAPEIQAAAVVTADGLPMASVLPPHVEEDRLAAMSAALLTLGEKAATGLGKGNLEQVFVEADDGYVVLMAAGRGTVLVTVADHDAKAGLVIFEMRDAAAKIATEVDGTEVDGTEVDGTKVDGPEAAADGMDDGGGEVGYEDLSHFDSFPPEDADEPVLDPFATPTDPFATPPPPPPRDEGDDRISSWN